MLEGLFKGLFDTNVDVRFILADRSHFILY